MKTTESSERLLSTYELSTTFYYFLSYELLMNEQISVCIYMHIYYMCVYIYTVHTYLYTIYIYVHTVYV